MTRPVESGRVAVVTGANRGIGAAIACALARDGFTVAAAARDPETLAGTVGSVEAAGGVIAPFACDVCDEDSVARLAGAVAALGDVHAVVANAGIAGPTAPLHELSLAQWQETLETDLDGVFLTFRAFLPGLIARRTGSLIAVSSMTGKRPLPGRTPYAAAKLGLIGLIRTLALEVGPYGLRGNRAQRRVSGPVLLAHSGNRARMPRQDAYLLIRSVISSPKSIVATGGRVRRLIMRHRESRIATMGAVGALLLGGCTAPSAPTPPTESPTASPGAGTSGPPELTRALAEIENDPRYRQSTWGYTVLDQASGETLAAQNADMMFDPGSTMKIYSVSAALQAYGTDYQFRTPVYRAGTVTEGRLSGNLVLVGSGDLSLGLREQPDGTLYYENTPAVDHSYANIGLPGAVEPPGNPLAGLDRLAQAVRAAGITQVDGNVVVDDRLFTPYRGFPDGLISPIWVNENLIDVLVTPGAPGQPASLSWRPKTASYTVENQVTTVAATQPGSLQITEPTPGRLSVTGRIAAGATPTLVVKEINDPSAFARTAFIEALQRAGVTVTAAPTGPNPEALLPPRDSYQPADKLGERVSATLAQYANLILKVSYNRGADLMTCLAAVKAGSTDCEQGLVAEMKTITGLGVPDTSVFPLDGAGSDDQGRSTPMALARFLKAVTATPYGTALADALPVLGRSGTLANVLPQSPAAGHAQIKTGNRAVGTPAGQIILLGNSLAGYVQARSGRQLTVMIAVGNVPLSTPTDVFTVTDDQARMIEAIQQGL